jgi:hypothetical protein
VSWLSHHRRGLAPVHRHAASRGSSGGCGRSGFSPRCAECQSFGRLDEVGLGNPGGRHLRLLGAPEESRRSLCRGAFFDGGHRHRWVLVEGSVDSLFWEVGCAQGSPGANSFARAYETAPEFREFVEARIRAGTLDRGQARRIVACPGTGGDPAVIREGRAVMEAFRRADPGDPSGAEFP